MENYGPFSENLHSFFSQTDPRLNRSFDEPRLNRNFEELVTQRGELSFEAESEPTDQNFYNSVFENIKEKLFIVSESDDIEISPEEIITYKSKYNIEDHFKAITKLKKQISSLYLKKTEHEVLLQEKRRKYTSFCENIKNCVLFIDEMNDQDDTLKQLLNERINWYYNELDIDNFINMEYNLKKEFTFLKKSIKEFVRISPTVCSICMEHEISWFIDPCGHTMCEQCKVNTERTQRCHYCRTEKQKLNRLYL